MLYFVVEALLYIGEWICNWEVGGGTGKGTAKKVFPLLEPSLDDIQSTTSTSE